MLPAEKTHYTKGLALGLTLAETFSIVVFILLLACAVLLNFEKGKRAEAEQSLEDARIDGRFMQGMLGLGPLDWGSAGVWYDYARELREQIDSLRSRLGPEDTTSVNPERPGPLEPPSSEEPGDLINPDAAALRDSVDALRRVISYLDQMLRDMEERAKADTDSLVKNLQDSLGTKGFREDTLQGKIGDLEQALADARAWALFLENLLMQYRQGIGIDPPPCWLDSTSSRPEYIFRVDLTNSGMRLFNIAPEHRRERDPDAFSYAAQIEEGREYSPTEFLQLTLPFRRLGVNRTEVFGPTGCRYWIRPVDLTGDRKDIFVERRDQLSRRFWFRWD